MRDVLKNLIDGMSEKWLKVGKYWRVPCKSAITQARQRLGARVMSNLFYRLVRPMATTETQEDARLRHEGGIFKWTKNCSH